MTTLIDTDALIGLVIEQDALHEPASSAHAQLAELGTHIYILSSTLGEFVSVCTNKIGVHATQQAVQTFVRTYSLIHITEQTMQDGLSTYYKQTSKENSLFDCYIMATANHLAADCIFSFDGGYARNKFILIEQYLTSLSK
jgi:predicted nucleic acid-binding protein